jgi:UDP-glucose 4-epimerase
VGITGARGFLGRPLSAALSARGWEVLPLARDAQGAGLLDAVVHLGFPTDHALRAERPMEALAAVTRGTLAAVECAVSSGARQLIVASSGKVYGAPRSLPIAEDHAIAPTTRLGRLKELSESIARIGAIDGSLAVTSLRIFNVFGPGQSSTFLVPKLIEASRSGAPITLGELDHRRDWLYVEDAVSAFVCALEQEIGAGTFRALNVGSGRSASCREIVASIERASGRSVRHRADPSLFRPDEPIEERADTSALRALGWSPRWELETALAHVSGTSAAIP